MSSRVHCKVPVWSDQKDRCQNRLAEVPERSLQSVGDPPELEFGLQIRTFARHE